MSTIVSTEAIVLRAMKFRETSKIVKFYTLKCGLVSGMVKGARQAKSRFGGPCLDPMAHVSLVFYRKEGRDLQTVSECSLMKDYRNLGASLEKMAAGMSAVEMLSAVAQEGEENADLFRLITGTLAAIDGSAGDPKAVLCWFELHLARILGFGMQFGGCVSCGFAETGDVFYPGRGGFLCARCAAERSGTMRLSPAVAATLRQIALIAGPEAAAAADILEADAAGCLDFLRLYLKHHLPDLRPLRSEKVFSRILPQS